MRPITINSAKAQDEVVLDPEAASFNLGVLVMDAGMKGDETPKGMPEMLPLQECQQGQGPRWRAGDRQGIG